MVRHLQRVQKFLADLCNGYFDHACVGDYLKLLKRLQPAPAQKRTPQQLTREMKQDRFVETHFCFIESKYATTNFRQGFQDKCVDLSVT